MVKVLLLYLLLAISVYAEGDPEVVSRTPVAPSPVIANSKDLGRTVVTADFDQSLSKNVSYIFSCSTFLAWNELVQLNGAGEIKVDQPNALIRILNEMEFTKDLISEQSYLVEAAKIEEGSIDSINERLRRKFKNPPTLENVPVTGQGALSFAYLEKDLSFGTPFEASLEVKFNGTIVSAFGYDGANKSDRYGAQFEVEYFDESKQEFVIQLISETKQDELILGLVNPEDSLRKTYNRILGLYNSGGSTVDSAMVEKLAVPKVNFHIDHHWPELLGRTITNGTWRGLKLLAARTSTHFRLDEKGAGVETFSYMRGEKSEPLQIIFDRPFMIILI